MAKSIINILEVVDIYQGKSKVSFGPLEPFYLLLSRLQEIPAIGQSCEKIF